MAGARTRVGIGQNDPSLVAMGRQGGGRSSLVRETNNDHRMDLPTKGHRAPLLRRPATTAPRSNRIPRGGSDDRMVGHGVSGSRVVATSSTYRCPRLRRDKGRRRDRRPFAHLPAGGRRRGHSSRSAQSPLLVKRDRGEPWVPGLCWTGLLVHLSLVTGRRFGRQGGWLDRRRVRVDPLPLAPNTDRERQRRGATGRLGETRWTSSTQSLVHWWWARCSCSNGLPGRTRGGLPARTV